MQPQSIRSWTFTILASPEQAVTVRKEVAPPLAAAQLHVTVSDHAASQPDGPCGRVHLLSLSTSFLWRKAVADIIGVKSSHALRNNSRCMWRPRESSQNLFHTAIRRALSLLRLCGSVTADAHG